MSKFKRVPLSSLTVGVVLTAPITDPFDPRVKLLAEGVEITQGFIDRLAARGIDTVVMSQRDLGILNSFTPQGRRTKAPAPHQYSKSTAANDQSKEIDRRISKQDSMDLSRVDEPHSALVKRPSDCSYSAEMSTQWARENDLQIEALGDFMEQAVHGRPTGVAPLRESCNRILDRMTEDQDAQVCMACSPYESEYPPRHGVHLASVAMSIGVEMGLDRAQLMDLGIGCMVHDVGMKAVGMAMFSTKKTLSPSQLQVLADHPVLAIELAGKYGDEVSHLSRMVVYQMHERCDGSGYPRGRTADEIHPLAKIAAVADALVAMLSRRAHRLAIQGYFAVKQLLQEMSERKYDAAVIRAMLHVTSLYPLGSLVELSNGCVGRVIRSGGDSFVQPTIEMWKADHLDKPPAIVNLREDTSIEITGSMPAGKAA